MKNECECGENCPTCEGCSQPLCECKCNDLLDESEDKDWEDFDW